MSDAFLVVGILGVLGMTWLFPCVGCLLWRLSKQRRQKIPDSGERLVADRLSVTIIVPAHNEADTLAATLVSICEARDALLKKFPGSKVDIKVGDDGSIDNTSEIAKRFKVQLYRSQEARGKWNTIRDLALRSGGSDWIGLADAGILWERDILLKLLPLFAETQVAGVAPAYRNSSGGIVERLLWAVERHFKTIESQAGGPVTLHGATVFYRANRLIEALTVLGTKSWLNDDVVLPLCIRTLHPHDELRYLPSMTVAEQTLKRERQKAAREYVRRRRIVMGNVEWIQVFLPQAWTQAPIVAMLALRRVFRLFWAYWGVAVVGALVIWSSVLLPRTIFHVGLVTLVLTLPLLCILSPAVRNLAQAAGASIAAPFYFFLLGRGTEQSLQPTVWR